MFRDKIVIQPFQINALALNFVGIRFSSAYQEHLTWE